MPASVERLTTSMRESLQLEDPQPSVFSLHHKHQDYLKQEQQRQQQQQQQQQQRLLQQLRVMQLVQQQQKAALVQWRLCCLPSGCPLRESCPIGVVRVGEKEVGEGGVKVGCSSKGCVVGGWMHPQCFAAWQQRLVACARSLDLRSQQGLAAVSNVTRCLCGQGHLFKDQTETTPTQLQLQQLLELSSAQLSGDDTRLRTFSCSSNEESSSPSSGSHTPPPSPPRDWLPLQHINISPPVPTYSNSRHWMIQNESPPPSLDNPNHTIPVGISQTGLVNRALIDQYKSNPVFLKEGLPQAFLKLDGVGKPAGMVDLSTMVSRSKPLEPLHYGNMFHHRKDLRMMRALRARARNCYNMRVGDEGQHGNDPTRAYILKYMTRAGVTSLPCAACNTELPVYDEFPLIDGTLFLSPRSYSATVRVPVPSKRGKCGEEADLDVVDGTRRSTQLYVNAVCGGCMGAQADSSTRLVCSGCESVWRGDTLVVGTLYNYDVFAGMSCCKARLECSKCLQPVQDVPLKSFSEASELKQCPHCGSVDHHLIKPLNKVFNIRKVE